MTTLALRDKNGDVFGVASLLTNEQHPHDGATVLEIRDDGLMLFVRPHYIHDDGQLSPSRELGLRKEDFTIPTANFSKSQWVVNPGASAATEGVPVDDIKPYAERMDLAERAANIGKPHPVYRVSREEGVKSGLIRPRLDAEPSP